jgi:hypothetical protein
MKCVECSHALRPQLARAADWPDTRDAAGRGLCRPCWRAVREGEACADVFDVQAARSALAGFLAERRTRLGMI